MKPTNSYERSQQMLKSVAADRLRAVVWKNIVIATVGIERIGADIGMSFRRLIVRQAERRKINSRGYGRSSRTDKKVCRFVHFGACSNVPETCSGANKVDVEVGKQRVTPLSRDTSFAVSLNVQGRIERRNRIDRVGEVRAVNRVHLPVQIAVNYSASREVILSVYIRLIAIHHDKQVVGGR